MSILGSICHRGGNERGATTMTAEMVPRQHSGSDSLRRYRCKRKSDGSVTCDRRWGDPGNRVPTRQRHGNGEHARNTSGTMQPGAFHTTYAFVHGRSFRGYTFEACVIGAVRVKRCSRSRSSWEVVVLGDGRGSSLFTRQYSNLTVPSSSRVVVVLGVFGPAGLVLATLVELDISEGSGCRGTWRS